MKNLILYFFLYFFLSTTLQAQYSCCERWSIGTNFTITIPMEDMQSNGFHTNYGLTLNGLYQLNPQNRFMNLHVGGRFTGGITIGERDKIKLEDPANASARSSVYNTLVDLLFMGRMVIGPENKIQPYFDIYGGGRLLGANQDIRLDRFHSDYDRRTSERIAQSGNWAWGSGTGVLIRFRKNAYLDFGVDYLQSESQRFVDLDNVTSSNDVVQYDVVNSISNSFGIHLGFHVKLDCNQQERYEEPSYNNRGRFKTRKRKPRAKRRTTIKN